MEKLDHQKTHTVEDVIEDLTQFVIDSFIVSEYPARPLYIFLPNLLELEIRMPPTLPDFILNKFGDITAGLRSCPSIEVIELPKWLQRQEFFETLVRKLGTIDGVQCVCVSNVANKEFSTYLELNSEWQTLNSMNLVGYKSFFRLSNSRSCV